jgi:hypothetical protein
VSGRVVVLGLLGSVAVLAAISWGIGLRIAAAIDEEASAHHLRKLDAREAAERVARDDRMGLPSRLPDPVPRDIERYTREGTVASPFPATKAGADELLGVYAVSVQSCRSRLPARLRGETRLDAFVTVVEHDGRGVVAAVDPPGREGDDRSYFACLSGAVRPAVFEAPEGGERTFPVVLELQ